MHRLQDMLSEGIVLTIHGVDAAGILPPAFYGVADARYTITADALDFILNAVLDGKKTTVSQASGASAHRYIVLTFDDGLASDYHIVFPRLVSQGHKATFFVNPATLDHPGYITSTELHEMHRFGMEIGSHGMTHRKLVELPSHDVVAEIADSKKALEDLLQAPVLSFAPVGGHYRSWMVLAARESGYASFATMVPGVTDLTVRPFMFRRNHIQSHHSTRHILSVLRADSLTIARSRVRYCLLNNAKQMLGISVYDTVRGWLLRLTKKAGTIR